MLSTIYILFLLQDPLSSYFQIPIVAWFDEFIAAICVIQMLYKMIRDRFKLYMSRDERSILVLLLLWFLVGIFSNLISQYQNIVYTFLDVFTCSKLYIGYFYAVLVMPGGISENSKRQLARITGAFVFVYFVLSIHDFFFTPFFPVLLANGFKSIQLIYSNVTYLAAYSVFLFLVLFYTKKYQKHFLSLAIMCSITIFLTFRSKAMGFVCIAWILYLWIGKAAESKTRLRMVISVPMGILAALFVAWDKIQTYFLNKQHFSPRRILLTEAIDMAGEYFPLGAGYGTYCSVASILNPSPIYSKMGYSYFSAVYDMFWGCVLGQFGYLGTVCFLGTVYFMYRGIARNRAYSRQDFFAAAFALLYLAVASIGECSFFSPYSIGYGFIIGLSVVTARNEA